VHIILGSAAGLTATGGQFWHQNSPSVPNACQNDDAFGTALAAGDFDNDGFDDLAVGVPGEGISGSVNAGAIHVLYGQAGGVGANRDEFWHQNKGSILEQIDAGEAGEGFGFSLVAGYFGGDAFCDLAIGVPNEDLGVVVEAGVVHVMYGRSTGLKPGGNQLWSQDSGGINDKVEEGDHFGFSLAAGDFDGDGRDDLAVGVPGETIGTNTNCGAVNVIYTATSKLASGGDQIWHQNRPNILEKCEEDDSFGSSTAP
jgi:hypothetical protein